MTNFDIIKENLTIEKMAFLMINMPNYCPFIWGCDKCVYYDEDNLGLCFSNENWTQRDYIDFLKSEVKE